MMYPYNLSDDEYELIAWSKERLSNKYVTGGAFDITNTADFKEPEIVYYPKTNSFCIQGHPEMMPKDSPINTYINNFVKNHINNYE